MKKIIFLFSLFYTLIGFSQNDQLAMNYFDKKKEPIMFPIVLVHSANPIGSANICGYINNFLMNETKPQTCIRAQIPHTV
jgi:hypothetical protein